MTKRELIDELHKNGEFWANETYSKKELENYLKGLERARNMSIEELAAYIITER